MPIEHTKSRRRFRRKRATRMSDVYDTVEEYEMDVGDDDVADPAYSELLTDRQAAAEYHMDEERIEQEYPQNETEIPETDNDDV